MSRPIAVLTTGRQDWGILRGLCAALAADARFDLKLIVGGMHLSPQFGSTIETIKAEGFRPAARLPWLDDEGETPAHHQAGRALAAIGDALDELQPEALVLVGDRFETAAAAVAATLAGIPVVHLHGGEETAGALDDLLRHAITKLSHLHLVSHLHHAERVQALGEDPATVHVVGALGTANGQRADLPDRADLEGDLGVTLASPVVLVTVHPTTLAADPAADARAVAAAMDQVPATYVITLPNADPGAGAVREIMVQAAAKPGRVALEALGERRFWGLMGVADAMLGNSSSALIEAPAMRLPAVNVGDRQSGRLRDANVIDVPATASAVVSGLAQALSPTFRSQLLPPAAPADPVGLAMAALAAWQPPQPPRKRVWMGE